MQVGELKEYILNNDLVETVLTELGCGHVRNKGEYISASNPNGDNPNAIITYLNENLTCIDYTRTLTTANRTTDIFDLIGYFKEFTFPETLRWTCNTLGIDYYREPEELPESLQIIKMLQQMDTSDDEDKERPLKPIPEVILQYYIPLPNQMFEDDGVSLEIQEEFEMGVDPQSGYITIPVRDALGSLCGIKGRYFGEPDEFHSKYTYLERCNKSKILYGYWQNRNYIKNNKYLYIVESEKGVQQLATMGVRNVVSTSGKTISKAQVELIIRTGCTPIFCFDQDVTVEDLQNVADMFLDSADVYAIVDSDGILGEKESPSDDPQKWAHLIKNNICYLK